MNAIPATKLFGERDFHQSSPARTTVARPFSQLAKRIRVSSNSCPVSLPAVNPEYFSAEVRPEHGERLRMNKFQTEHRPADKYSVPDLVIRDYAG